MSDRQTPQQVALAYQQLAVNQERVLTSTMHATVRRLRLAGDEAHARVPERLDLLKQQLHAELQARIHRFVDERGPFGASRTMKVFFAENIQPLLDESINGAADDILCNPSTIGVAGGLPRRLHTVQGVSVSGRRRAARARSSACTSCRSRRGTARCATAVR